MKGRKPVPTVLKLLRNNPGKRRMNESEPVPGTLATEAPEELDGDENGAREWKRTIAPAIGIGQITAADRAPAIIHCVLWSTWRSQLADAAQHAHVVAVGKNKYPTPNPARMMANKTLQLLLKVDAELGLTPVSRTRVTSSGSVPQQSAVDQFRDRRHATGW